MTSLVIGVDAGKTGSRVAVEIDGAAYPVAHGRGVVATPGPHGVRRAASALARVVEAALRDAGVAAAPSAVGIGVAGLSTLEGGADALATSLAPHWPGASVAVTADYVTAHAGALGGGAGVVLAVGTGSVALGMSEDGVLRRVDGWGQWLGDDGSGAWIGREALRAAVRAADGRGEGTALLAAAEERFAEPSGLPAVLPFEAGLPTRTAAFAPDVVAAADAGDAVAGDILRRAVHAWAESTHAAARAVGAGRAACVGGLADVESMYRDWAAQVAPRLRAVEAHGSSLDGALLIAGRDDLPHESQVSRRTGAASAETGGDDLDLLETEGVRAGLDDLDVRSSRQIVDVLLGAESRLPEVLDAAREGLAAAVSLAERALRDGGRIVYAGAGTPGRLAALDAAECPPTFGVSPDRVIALLAGGDDAAGRAIEGAEDRADDAARAVARHDVGASDVLVGVSASGRTPYVLAAIRAAAEKGAATVAVVNNPDSVMADAADVAVELLTGAEVIGGSTRLTAGTAQKVALNTLSSATMVRMGKTYGPRMVDVVASNHKLRRRASRIVREVCDVDGATAAAALEAADWHTKTAIVSLLAGVDVDEARTRLASADGRVRAALEVGS